MAHRPGHSEGARRHFTRLSDDCPICRLMEQLDREGLLEDIPLDELDELQLDGVRLEPFAFAGPRIEPFDRLTVDELRALRPGTPAEPPLAGAEGAPGFDRLLELGERYPGMLYHGFRVDPGGPADHVLLSGFYVPAGCAQRVLAQLASRPTIWESVHVGGLPYWRAEWL